MKEKRQKQAISWPAFFDPYYYGYLIHRGLLPAVGAHSPLVTPSGMTSSPGPLDFTQLASAGHASQMLGTSTGSQSPGHMLAPGMALLQPPYNLISSTAAAANQLSTLASLATNYSGVPKLDFPSTCSPTTLQSYHSSSSATSLTHSHSHAHSPLKTSNDSDKGCSLLPSSKDIELDLSCKLQRDLIGNTLKLESHTLASHATFMSALSNKDILKNSVKDVDATITPCSTQ